MFKPFRRTFKFEAAGPLIFFPHQEDLDPRLVLIRYFHTRLIAINAASLVFAIIFNLSLLLNMARRLSFTIAEPITIVGWNIASVLLIALVSTAKCGPQTCGGSKSCIDTSLLLCYHGSWSTHTDPVTGNNENPDLQQIQTERQGIPISFGSSNTWSWGWGIKVY